MSRKLYLANGFLRFKVFKELYSINYFIGASIEQWIHPVTIVFGK
jgi:hypothetical protein